MEGVCAYDTVPAQLAGRTDAISADPMSVDGQVDQAGDRQAEERCGP